MSYSLFLTLLNSVCPVCVSSLLLKLFDWIWAMAQSVKCVTQLEDPRPQLSTRQKLDQNHTHDPSTQEVNRRVWACWSCVLVESVRARCREDPVSSHVHRHYKCTHMTIYITHNTFSSCSHKYFNYRGLG